MPGCPVEVVKNKNSLRGCEGLWGVVRGCEGL